MSNDKDPFDVLVIEEDQADRAPAASAVPAAEVARLHGFDLQDRPLLVNVAGLPGEVVPARSAVPLLRAQAGSAVVVLFERGDLRRPIVVGVLQGPTAGEQEVAPGPLVSVQADDQRLVFSAEREIVLRCGDASITLTRAGKVLIKGAYILSRSSGYNRIKGAAVDIN
jgi:hypothetical protein